ncbi:MAG TPA: hypothetical protein VGN86_17320 [Pyrinomonadaceae bacterium]|jgi:hypothetical protein|nr:hypothetical protein [Pyrinomonadaceae bacterium]
MNVKCSASTGGTPQDEFQVQTWSGDETQSICAVRGTPKIRHHIQVINQSLRLSPKRVRCEGIVSSSEPVIRFVPENPNDTPAYWLGYVVLQDGERRTLSRSLEAIEGAAGIEEIGTTATVEWISSGKTQTFSLKIEVSTD